jgi:glycosyltransferase involved in cell wall biosynthesis
MQKIKVMHILTDTNIGGAGTLLYNTMCCGDATRFDYIVVLPKGSRLIDRFMPLNCRVVTVKCGQNKSFEISALTEYVRLIRRERPDILHTHAALTARLAGKICRVPVCIQTRHCVFPMAAWQKNALFRFMFRHGSRILSDRVIAVADAAKDNLVALGMDADQIEVIINGVLPLRQCGESEVEAVRDRWGLDEAHFVIGMIARLEEYKGQETVLRAAALCKNAAPNMRFIFMGDGSQIDRYRCLARELDMEERVIFTGFIDDVAPYYALMSVNVNASFGTETSSLALSEGMSVGRAAVVSDYGGNGAMVENGVSGVVVSRADSNALAAALSWLEGDRTRLARMNAAALLRYNERFTPQRMTRELEDFYLEQLCGADRKRKSIAPKIDA